MGNPTSNTNDCFREFIGQRVKGVILTAENRMLVFEDGRALTVHHNGSYWVSNAVDVSFALAERRRHLQTVEREIRDLLTLAGEKVEEP
jgi:hypothetical protein